MLNHPGRVRIRIQIQGIFLLRQYYSVLVPFVLVWFSQASSLFGCIHFFLKTNFATTYKTFIFTTRIVALNSTAVSNFVLFGVAVYF